MGKQTPAEEVSSFDASSDAKARVLVLGSMPGVASLEAVQYYAHPRNSFWRIMESLFAISSDQEYEQRLSGLRKHHVALWDVLRSCSRPGSLDSDIRATSEVPNAFADFLPQHPDVHTIFFNGRKAEQVFKRKALPQMLRQRPELESRLARIRLIALPSTSPAMASLSFSDKLEQWQTVAEAARTPTSL